MKLSVVGSHLCPDTLFALHKLKEYQLDFDFMDISASFPALHHYLELRDSAAVYRQVKESGRIGIPLFIVDDIQTFDLDVALAQALQQKGG